MVEHRAARGLTGKIGALLFALALLVAACGGGDDSTETSGAEESSDAPTESAGNDAATEEASDEPADATTEDAPDEPADATTEDAPDEPADATTEDEPEPEPTPEPEPDPAMTITDDTVGIVWDNLPSTPVFLPADASSADPFYFIHTNPESDGFYFSIEMYTTGYGTAWTGELGDVEVSCSDTSTTGICPYFDEDGPGPIDVLGSDFATTGSITINQLDDSGYDIVVNEIVFSNGTTIGSFRLTG